MNTGLRLVTILLPLIVTAGARPGGVFAQDAKDTKAGKIYESPLNDFEIAAPKFCLGTKIQQRHDETGGMIAFLSDVGQLDRIDFERLDPSVATSLGVADPVMKQTVYAEHLRSTLLQSNEASLLATEPLTIGEMQGMFAVAEFPAGGVLEAVTFREGKMVSERMDSVRGLMVFARGDIIYVLHHEVGVDFDSIWDCGLIGQGGPQLTDEERDLAAKEGIEQLYGMIRFK